MGLAVGDNGVAIEQRLMSSSKLIESRMNKTNQLASGIVLFVAFSTVEGADLLQSTVVEFPSDRPVGRYVLVDRGTTWQQVDTGRDLAKRLRPAQNRVSIPAEKHIMLALMGQRSNGKKPLLEPLDQLHESQLLSVTFVFCNLVPEDIERLKRHQQLKMFATTLSKMNDVGLAAVCSSAGQLESLSVPETQITNKGLAAVSQLSNLQQLNIYGTGVTEAGLIHLKTLRHLQELDLGLTRTDGSGLQHLKPLTQLRKLTLWKTNVHDDDLVHLETLLHLERLDLKESNVTDAGLPSLASLKKLKFLDLSYNRVTDAGLDHLKHLDQLESLLLLGTGVSDSGAKQLKLAIPTLKITLVDGPNLKALGAEAIRQNDIKRRKDLDKYFESWE